MTQVSFRRAFSAAAMAATMIAALAFITGAIARAQGAAGAGSSNSTLPAQPSPSGTSGANSSSLPAAANTSARAVAAAKAFKPITPEQRLWWIFMSTLGPRSLLFTGPISSAIGTGLDHPSEYGPGWEGFGQRYGMRLTGIATSNVMEAGLGAIWGEDPRYQREPEKSFRGRLGSVVEQGFIAKWRDGSFHPAYARYMSVTGSNFLSNTWRADSEADWQHALARTGYGFAGRIGANAWSEFWPDIKTHVLHRGN